LDNLSLRPERRDLEVVDQFTERPSALLVCWAAAHGAFPRLEYDPLRNPQPLLGLALPAPPLGLPDRPTGADVNPLALIVEVAALVNEVEVRAGEADPGPLPIIREGVGRLGPRDAAAFSDAGLGPVRSVVSRCDPVQDLRHPLQCETVLDVVGQEL